MRYDVAVVGGGHAGIEAALASARMGCSTVLVTARTCRIGEMSCNPAIGGIAKGTLVREIDALGGAMAESADVTAIQHRMLNRRKGPAVWGPRVQSDSPAYAARQRSRLAECGVDVLEDEVLALAGDTAGPSGLVCRRTGEIGAGSIVIAAGTFLAARLFRGSERWRGGRIGDISSDALEEDLRRRMFHVKRFKTGTSPRIVRRSVDHDRMELQEDEPGSFRFSFRNVECPDRRERCYTVRTNGRTREAALGALGSSPLFAGAIEGRGPRYCPSFEDKVVKFPDRTEHLVHVEPTGYGSRLLYLNGLSTSLPREAQERMVRSLPGFERAEIALFGYAVEYSSLDNTEIDRTLRLKRTENVFAAGQILGTSGYEEAAALGLLAGANAARLAGGKEPIFPCRAGSFLGVMVDDLSGVSRDEPYRLFSSRAENRLEIRQDNALTRMMPFAEELGTALAADAERFESRRMAEAGVEAAIDSARIEGRTAREVCRRPGWGAGEMIAAIPGLVEFGQEAVASVILDEKYRGYVRRSRKRLETRERIRSVSLDPVDSYMEIPEICFEAREALEAARPRTLGEAERIPGVRTADIEGLVVYLGRRGRRVGGGST